MWIQPPGTDNFFSISSTSTIIDKLPSNSYELEHSMQGPYLSKIEQKDEELLNFDDEPYNSIINEVTKFWNMENNYKKLSLPYRRGILIHGEPGTGKTGIIRLLINQLLNNNGTIFYINSVGDLAKLSRMLDDNKTSKYPVFIIEDLDQLLQDDEETLLNILDGSCHNFHGALFIATTNYFSIISPRAIRPSRFDRIIEIKYPSTKVRTEYLRSLFTRYNIPINKQLIEASSGLSFASMKELFISHVLYELPIKDTVSRLLQIQEHTADNKR